MEPLFRWLGQYGYAGLFLLLVLGIAGLPIPDETLLVIAGVLVAKGKLNLALTLIAGYTGSIGGISLSYLIGRKLGAPLIYRYGKYVRVTPQHIERVHEWFRRTGEWLLTFGYFILAVRHFTALVAGMSKLEFPVFALFAYSGGILWVSTFVALGYFLGDNWESAMRLIHEYTLAATGILVIIVIIAVWIRARMKKRLAPTTPIQNDRD